jgi:hypothetical protein
LQKILYKINCPSYLTDFVKIVSDTSTRTTRVHKYKLRTPRVGVDVAKNSFIAKSSRLWNNLPEKLCLNSNMNLFKIAVQKLYFDGYKLATYWWFSSLWILFNVYYFECLYDVIYEAENALRNINKHHLQLKENGILIRWNPTMIKY